MGLSPQETKYMLLAVQLERTTVASRSWVQSAMVPVVDDLHILCCADWNRTGSVRWSRLAMLPWCSICVSEDSERWSDRSAVCPEVFVQAGNMSVLPAADEKVETQ